MLLGAASADGQASESDQNCTVSGRANVHVDTNDGSVRVTTGDTKQVELRVIYNGYTLDKNLEIKSKQDGDRVELSARETMHWNWGIHVNRGLRLEVRMPKDADLSVDSGDGSVEAQTITGNLDIHTGDGHIRVMARRAKSNCAPATAASKAAIWTARLKRIPATDTLRSTGDRHAEYSHSVMAASMPTRCGIEGFERVEHPHGRRKRGF